MESLLQHGSRLWDEATRVWLGGGWCMVPIAATAILMFYLGLRMRMRLADKGFQGVSETVWRRWLRIPEDREGPLGRIIASAVGLQTLPAMAFAFAELRAVELAPFRRDIKVMKVCVGAAPLLGLLGTVTGMLGTFEALATGSGGQQTMGHIAKGISEALITTETGLIIALPGLFMGYMLGRRLERYQAFLGHVESVCTQDLYRRIRGAGRAAPPVLQTISPS